MYIILLLMLSSADAVTLTGSSEYAVPGTEFTLTCDVPEEANLVRFYRRPDVTAIVGGVQVGGDQCYNANVSSPVPCTPDVCSCVTSGGLGTVFGWIIQPQTGDHGSVWYCRRTNLNLPNGNQELESADYTLNVADGPGTSIALSPPDTTYTRTEGDTLPDITCTADCRPDCTFVWTRPDNTNFTVSPVLSLGQLNKSEHGTYRCTARNDVGESTIITSVTVQYGPSTVSLTPPTVTYTATEGQTIPTITCSADCNPACTYSWTKDGQSYTTGSGLQLTSIQRGQAGVYRCTAGNNHGSDINVTINVSVNYGPSTVSLTPPTVTYTPIEGQPILTITCSADCDPVCTYSWTKDGQFYTTGSGLQLTNIQRGQGGVYRCTASNVYGSARGDDVNITVYYGPGTSIAMSPTDTTYTRKEGDTLPNITCTADCRPGCTFVWTRPDNTNFTVSPVLSLGQLNRSENGLYRCTARNVAGESTIITRVTVQFPPSISDLNFKTGDGNLIEGGSTSVVCTVESFPPSTIQWFYKANNTRLQTTTDVLESTYRLNNAACMDTGVYTCSVRNSVSKTVVTRSIHINVLCKPREDLRVNYNHKVGLATSENMTVTAFFLANPVPDFIWTFQNASSAIRTDLVNGTDNFIIRNSFDGTNLSAVSIGIRKTMQEHWFGTYNVTATNSQGSGRISFIVEAKGKPNPPYEGAVICPDSDQAILSWRSAFDGGSTQTFVVGRRSQTQDKFVIDRKLDTPDPGQHRTVNISIPGLAAGTQYFFVVFAVNKFGNSTIEHKVSCTTQDSQTHSRTCGTDSMYVPGVVLTIIGVLSLLLTLGLEIVFRRNRKLCCSKCQFLKQNENEFQNVQLSERDRTPHRDNERSLYDQLDTNDVAKPSVYSELGGLHHAYQNDPVSDGGDSNRQYESLKGRAASNVYDEPHNLASGEKGTYVNTIIGGNKKH